MKIGLVQMVSTAQVATNLVVADRLVREAAAQGAELVVLPENFGLLGHNESDKVRVAEPAGGGPMQEMLATLAASAGVWVVGGTVPLQSDEPDRVTNSCLVYSPQGRMVCRYDKIHLFVLDNESGRFDESRTVAPGHSPAWFDLPASDGHVWRVGLSVCYDLRFPELYRALAVAGAYLLLVPSAFTHGTGEKHWDVLLRARAIENLAWVGAPAQGGIHENGRRTWGHSLVVDPWGEVVARLPVGEGVIVVQMDAGQTRRRRAELPALGHRVL